MVAAVLSPYDQSLRGNGHRDSGAKLEEAIGLARAIDLDVRLTQTVPLRQVTPATLLGKGVVERVKGQVEELGIGLVVVDDRLTPVQQRNLEKAWNAKVIDRTGLILEIFGARAQTHEGRLQVELAALDYQRGRLVRSWTHLERQRGGFGFLGGPGESQIEIDRRLIGETHGAHQARPRRSEAHASDQSRRPPQGAAADGGAGWLHQRRQVDAVQSPLGRRCNGQEPSVCHARSTMRSIKLPSGRDCVLSDTVGFVSDLPTHLVAAFRATLEEVIEADLIVHVRDIAHPDSERQRVDVEEVLTTLGAIDESGGTPMIEALNKTDALPAAQRTILATKAAAGRERATQFPVSALTGEGVDALLVAIEECLASDAEAREVLVPLSDGATLAWLYRHGEVRSRHDEGDTARLTVALDAAASAQFDRRQGNQGQGQTH